MHHRGHHEGKLMGAERDGISLFYQNRAAVHIKIKELFHHSHSLCGAYDLCLRVNGDHIGDGRTVVRLHVVYDQIVQSAAV